MVIILILLFSIICRLTANSNQEKITKEQLEMIIGTCVTANFYSLSEGVEVHHGLDGLPGLPVPPAPHAVQGQPGLVWQY